VTTTATDDRVYFGVHHYLHEIENGMVVKRRRDKVSMIADRGRLALTVVDSDGQESTVSLDLEQVSGLIEQLPVLRDWMLTGEPAAH
jgi:hypothetical protein